MLFFYGCIFGFLIIRNSGYENDLLSDGVSNADAMGEFGGRAFQDSVAPTQMG